MSAHRAIKPPLPHSLEAERAVLGSIFLLNSGKDEAMLRLQSTDFFLPEHQIIYRHLTLLAAQGKPPDIVLVHDSLRASNELEAAGGAAYLAQITDGMPRVCNVSFYAEMVKLKACLRQRAYVAEKIMEMAIGANGNAMDVLQEIEKLSTDLRAGVGQKRTLNFISGPELAKSTNDQVDWTAKPYVARGAITELAAKVKMGKTTLMLHLVHSVLTGSDFMGAPTSQSPVVYLSEQPQASFRQAAQRAEILDQNGFCILFHTAVRGIQWPQVVACAIARCKELGARLLVVDTLLPFSGLKADEENNAGSALESMEPLQQAADAGIAVIIVRHERKSGGNVGDSGRGSSAISGAVDIVLSLRRPEGNSKQNKRVLHALSRFEETPPEILIELTERGFIALGTPHEAAVPEAKVLILAAATKTVSKALTIQQISQSSGVSRVTAQRAIVELLKENKFSRVGKGKRGDPFRYFIPENPFCPTSNVNEQKETNGTSPVSASRGNGE